MNYNDSMSDSSENDTPLSTYRGQVCGTLLLDLSLLFCSSKVEHSLIFLLAQIDYYSLTVRHLEHFRVCSGDLCMDKYHVPYITCINPNVIK